MRTRYYYKGREIEAVYDGITSVPPELSRAHGSPKERAKDLIYGDVIRIYYNDNGEYIRPCFYAYEDGVTAVPMFFNWESADEFLNSRSGITKG